MRAVFALLCTLSLAGCVGGTLGDASEFEMFPLRAATTEEGRDLKHCLKAANAAQNAFHRRHGHYARRVKELPIDDACNGFRLGETGTPTGYEIRAELREDETAVRWSVNEKGLIEEHLEPENDPDLIF